jgi:hypothetical protein
MCIDRNNPLITEEKLIAVMHNLRFLIRCNFIFSHLYADFTNVLDMILIEFCLIFLITFACGATQISFAHTVNSSLISGTRR